MKAFFIIDIVFILTTFGMSIGYTRYKQFKINLRLNTCKGRKVTIALVTHKKSRTLIQVTVKFQIFKKEIIDLLILLKKCLQDKLAILVFISL